MDGPLPQLKKEIDNGVEKQQSEYVLAKPYVKKAKRDKNIYELLGPPESTSQDSNSTEPTQVSAEQEEKKMEIQLGDWKTLDDVKTTS
ncbi:unnamed protein product [Cylicocyclus nassatus]|uniref:Uncharacterized protein n=1 Tax=Cylicocyclus nassatus TaxID=53992 RepID=A0AA36GHX1_CYLNA|nr:unnamed protein product [Cylicocyclus nassatus]